ncbi:MAG: VTT domain-containing protein [bacterium]|nr:VTT domain-containing protein [bacterium]
MDIHLKPKQIGVIAIVALAGFWIWGLLSSEGIVDRGEAILRMYADRNVAVAFLAFFVFAALSVLLGPFTSGPLVPAAVLLWGELATFLLLFAGWLAGGMAAYAMGRRVGYPIVRRIVSEEKAESWRHYISEHTTFFMALLFRVAMPAETGYVFGIVRYHIVKYALITTIVEAPLAAALVWASDALVVQDISLFMAWVGGMLLVFGGAGYALRNQIRRAS